MGNVSHEAMIIDPGADAETIIAFLKDKQLTPKIVAITHGHGDHIGANAMLKEAFPDIQICVHEEDHDMLPYPARNLSILAAFYGGRTVRSPSADRLLKDGDTVTVGKYSFEIIHTPTHTRRDMFIQQKSGERAASGLIFRRHPFQRRHWTHRLPRLQPEKANPCDQGTIICA